MTGNPIPLNDFITLQRGHDLPHKNRVEGNVPVVASTGIAGYHNEAKAKAPGVILGRSGSIGGGQYITEDYWPLNTTLWVKDFKGHNERFIYYLLKSIDFSSFNVGSGVPTLNRNHLSSILIDDKGRQFEDKVAKILGDIDDKIAVNIQINQTLEQIAQAIFKSWFVDFDPVKAKIEALAAGGNADDAELAAMGVISAKTLDELNSLKASNPEQFNKLAQTATLFPKDLDSETGTPAGWNSGVIADIAKLNANSWTKKNRPEQVHYVDLSNTKNGRIETVTTYGFDEAPSRARRILNSGDTIIGTVRPGNRAFAFIGETEKPLTGSTGFAVLSPKEEFWTSFVYLATTNDDAIDEYARLADGGAYPAIKPEVVADTPCVLPTKDIAQKFWRLTGAMLKKAHQARLENEELAKTRDTLAKITFR